MAAYYPASQDSFLQRSDIRILEVGHTERFKSFKEIQAHEARENEILADLMTVENHKYLAYCMGEPGIVQGVRTYAISGLVFSPNLKMATQLCSARTQGNKIKFGWGSDEVKHDRSECWEIAAERHQMTVKKEMRTTPPQVFPLVITRPENKACPVCFDDLSGNALACINKHQVCLPCFRLLSGQRGQKKCPTCRGQYHDEELSRFDKMVGDVIRTRLIFEMDEDGGNSFRMFQNNEALMLGVIRQAVRHQHNLDAFETLLLSSFFNFYWRHPDAFNSYGFSMTVCVSINARQLVVDDCSEYCGAFSQYLDAIESYEVISDIEKTKYGLPQFQYSDTNFYEDLEKVYGDEGFKKMKDYPGYERLEMLKRKVLFLGQVKTLGREGVWGVYMRTMGKLLARAANYPLIYKIEEVRISE